MQPVFAQHGVDKVRVNPFDAHTNEFANELIANAVAPFVARAVERPLSSQ